MLQQMPVYTNDYDVLMRKIPTLHLPPIDQIPLTNSLLTIKYHMQCHLYNAVINIMHIVGLLLNWLTSKKKLLA